ncbi:hypothetical protein K438DRAFT_1284342 [Mycena galopus ATCC 62051]|nr:hypothetical protein K438DRAFT_1284342 [Mycena galopus ATCC 62051]
MPDAAGTRETIDLVSPAATPAPIAQPVDLVSPTASEGVREEVRSPAPTGSNVPLSLLVSRASEALSEGGDVAAATAALDINAHSTPPVTPPTEDFPPLPPAGADVMSPRSAATRRQEKSRKRKTPDTSSPTEGTNPAVPAHAPTTEYDTRDRAAPAPVDPLTALAQQIAQNGTVLSDHNIAALVDANVAPDPHLFAQAEVQVAASLRAAELPTTAQEDADIHLAQQRSLGLEPEPANDEASSSRHMGEGPFLRPVQAAHTAPTRTSPKRPRIDTGARHVRAGTEAAQHAAGVATAAMEAAQPTMARPLRPATAGAALPNLVPPRTAQVTAAALGAAFPVPAPPPAPHVQQPHAPAPQFPPPPPPAVHATADGNAPRIYTTPGPFPDVTGINQETLFYNADPDHIREWKRNANLVVLWISGGTSDRVRDAQAAQLLVEGVTNSAPGTIRVGAARSADPSIPAPNVFGVDGLTATLADDLIRRPVLSTSEITFFAFSPDPPISPFMGIVQGLTYPNTRAGGQDAAAAILQNVSENPRLTQLLLSHRDALPPVWTVDQVLRYVFGSLAVTAMELDAGGGASRTVWRVFMAPTTENVKFHDAIRAAFTEISFATTWNNTGEVRADMECRVCPSIDHPSGLCPFPLVPGWMGVTHTTLPPLATTSQPTNARGGGRGGRARGRGRGNNGGN